MSKSAPDTMRRTPGLRAWGAATVMLALGAAGVAGLTLVFDDYLLTLLAIVFLNVSLAVSLNITNGLTGLFSLGHPAFMTVGGYVAAILTYPERRKAFMLPDLPAFLATTEIGLLPAVVTGGLAATLVAVVVGYPVLRLRGHYLAVATLGLIVIVQVLATNWDGYTRGGMGLNSVPRLTTVWWAFGAMALTVYAAWRIKFSSFGRAMMATRDNELAAECAGVNTFIVRLTAFALGAFFAGIAGALLVHLITVITPKTYSVLLAFNLVVMVVIGGSGSIVGAIIAAIGLTVLSESVRPVEEALGLYGMSQVVVALSLIGVLLFQPKGLFGSREPAPVVRFLRGGSDAS